MNHYFSIHHCFSFFGYELSLFFSFQFSFLILEQGIKNVLLLWLLIIVYF